VSPQSRQRGVSKAAGIFVTARNPLAWLVGRQGLEPWTRWLRVFTRASPTQPAGSSPRPTSRRWRRHLVRRRPFCTTVPTNSSVIVPDAWSLAPDDLQFSHHPPRYDDDATSFTPCARRGCRTR